MVYSTRRFVVCLSVCHFVLVFFSPFSIAITSLGEERANLSVFRTFVRFVLVWICRFPLPLGVWEGLRFVIVALPGLFFYFFYWTSLLIRSYNQSWGEWWGLWVAVSTVGWSLDRLFLQIPQNNVAAGCRMLDETWTGILFEFHSRMLWEILSSTTNMSCWVSNIECWLSLVGEGALRNMSSLSLKSIADSSLIA